MKPPLLYGKREKLDRSSPPPITAPYRVSLGLAEIDEVLPQGLGARDLCLISAQVAGGKSALLRLLSGNLAREKGPVLFADVEQSSTQSSLTTHGVYYVNPHGLQPEKSPSLYIEEMLSELKPHKPLKVLAIDDLSLLYSSSGSKELLQATRWAKSIAQAHDCLVIATAPSNHWPRKSTPAPQRRRASRQIEQIADLALTIGPTSAIPGQGPYEVVAIKNRYGMGATSEIDKLIF